MFDFLKFYKSIRKNTASLNYIDSLDNQEIRIFSPNANYRRMLYASFKNSIIVFKNDVEAQDCYNLLKRDYPNLEIAFMPAKDEIFNINADELSNNSIKRLNSLHYIINHKNIILLTSLEAIITPIISKNILIDKQVELVVGNEIDFLKLSENLVSIGYEKVEKVTQKGEFSINGDVLNIFPVNSIGPYKVSFFDSEIETIKKFDISSGFSFENVDGFNIFSATEIYLEGLNLEKVKKFLDKKQENLSSSSANILREKSENALLRYDLNKNANNLFWLTPYDKSNYDFISNYFDEKVKFIFDFELNDLEFSNFLSNKDSEYQELLKNIEINKEHIDMLFLGDRLLNEFKKHPNIIFQDQENIEYPCDIRCNVGLNFQYFHNYKMLISDIYKTRHNKTKMYIFTGNTQKAEKMSRGLQEENIILPIENIDNIKSDIALIPEYFFDGFDDLDNEIKIVGMKELLGNKVIATTESSNVKKLFSPPKIGDYVVHEYYGIGKCISIERKKIDEIERDYVIIEYHANAKVFLPVEQLDKIQKYTGGDLKPKLSKLGDREFLRTKKRVRASVKALAFDLLELYAKRETVKGYKYKEDDDYQIQLEEDFQFIETPGQINAINDIKQDMESGKVMDRLICGDVGFGKTEVALRAAFKTVLNNKQVVLMVPTTILARQHYRLFTDRLEKYGVVVKEISRLVSKSEYNESIKLIKEGLVDIVIGTHKILSKDLVFHDLGLLILDEEQKFGVAQKAKLKNLKNNINILALSATPIPRTLSISLNGIRDISIIADPPKNRIPIKTSVQKLDYQHVYEAIKKELERDGQVFIMHNRVDDLDSIYRMISSFSPEIRAAVCYGQMKKEIIEKRISDFYDKKINVLITTSIIENGIDVPNANCLIVLDATRYGLSQLYQIRGRIGRSNVQAYAYFYYSVKELSNEARERLSALKQFNELGSGFQIALRDLEMRGAGNILGPEQSGHIVEVGYELYCKMLDEEIKKAKGEIVKTEQPISIAVNIDSYMPDNYITDISEKLLIYKQISEIKDLNDKNVLIDKLIKAYGEIPIQLVNLINSAYVKNILSTYGVIYLDIKNKSITIIVEAEELKDAFMLLNIFDSLNIKYKTFSDNGKFNIQILNNLNAKLNLECLVDILDKRLNLLN